MTKLPDLGVLFRVVAIVEFAYAAIGLLTPPHLVYPLTGWSLSADGQWVTKLLALALLSQAWIAWTMRNQPHPGVALALALYQIGSATADWVMWLRQPAFVMGEASPPDGVGQGRNHRFDPGPLCHRYFPALGGGADCLPAGGPWLNRFSANRTRRWSAAASIRST